VVLIHEFFPHGCHLPPNPLPLDPEYDPDDVLFDGHIPDPTEITLAELFHPALAFKFPSPMSQRSHLSTVPFPIATAPCPLTYYT
jgi:hypothetical protein